MVKVVTSLGSTGLADWIVQRFTAILIALYVIFMVVYFFIHPNPTYSEWSTLFSNNWMRTCTFVVFLSIIMHAWVGLWIVSTDYLKHLAVRLIVQMAIIFTLLGCLVWSIEILWGL